MLGREPTLPALKTSLLGTGDAAKIGNSVCFQLLFTFIIPKTSWETKLLYASVPTWLHCIVFSDAFICLSLQ